jgi:hypothetical protein
MQENTEPCQSNSGTTVLLAHNTQTFAFDLVLTLCRDPAPGGQDCVTKWSGCLRVAASAKAGQHRKTKIILYYYLVIKNTETRQPDFRNDRF